MANDIELTEEQKEELHANMYRLKYSQNETEALTAAKDLLEGHMDTRGIKRLLINMSTEILSKDITSEKIDESVETTFQGFRNVVGQLFLTSFRMGMIECDKEWNKKIAEIKSKQAQNAPIGTPVEETKGEEQES